ncbi:4-hydroxybenzoate octaprenyltransferase [Candidatus Pelagibacter bacterium]|nr:4-hydroxybenzoate octaprenyltransferase [Candidatus Pelagibacter bacterium]
MKQLKIFIDLTRLNKPIGFMLLFWPCSWGLAYAFNFSKDVNIFFYYLALFFLGSVLMRSAGCIINDIVDRNFDKRVKRTKNRPIASGKISIEKSFIYSIILCLLAFIILIQFNLFTIFLGLSSMFLAFSYPYMKRITYWPQLFLGLTFNWGIIMAWVAVNNTISTEIILLYTSAIFWTLGYDSIYGVQDMADDEIIGLKSTAIKFKKNIKLFVSMNYFLTSSFLLYLFRNEIDLNLFSIFFILFCLSLIYQIKIFNSRRPETCLRAFKFNNLSGFILFLGILSI